MNILEHIFLISLSSILVISCKCSNSNNDSPVQTNVTPELVSTTKEVLADNVLAMIDDWGEEFVKATNNLDNPLKLEISDSEMAVIPDYLLSPEDAPLMVKKSQKVWALAELICEIQVREAYRMSIGESMEAISRLGAELNHPITDMRRYKNCPMSETVRELYNVCKDRGELVYFWQFQNAVINSLEYLISRNPNLYLSEMSEEQWASYRSRFCTCIKVVNELAKYDSEMAGTQKIMFKYGLISNEKEADSNLGTLESAVNYYTVNKEKFEKRRNSMLK